MAPALTRMKNPPPVKNLDVNTPLSKLPLQFDKTLVFYAKPLVAKWLKAFKTPRILIVSAQSVNTNLWQTRFKSAYTQWRNFDDARHALPQETEQWDMLVVRDPQLTPETVITMLPLLKKSGACLLVTGNLHRQWPQWQPTLEAHDLSQLFAMGFHPKGAVAWWPFTHPVLVWPGKLVEFLATFFPGRTQAALRWGQGWIIRGIKRYDRTDLTENPI